MNGPYPAGTQLELEAFIETIPGALAETAAKGASTLVVYDGSRYGNGDVLKLDDGDPQLSICELVTLHASAAVSGNTLTLAAGTTLARGHGVGTPVYKLSAATIAGTWQREAGTETSVTMNSQSTGRYRGTYTTTAADAGDNQFEVVASGAAVGARIAGISVLTDTV